MLSRRIPAIVVTTPQNSIFVIFSLRNKAARITVTTIEDEIIGETSDALLF